VRCEGLDHVREIAVRRHLERQPLQQSALAALERNRFLPESGGEKGAVLALVDHGQTDDRGEIIELPLEIRRAQGRLADAFDLNHSDPRRLQRGAR
jgi:hypothetical protein